jgi:hypothetical protein
VDVVGDGDVLVVLDLPLDENMVKVGVSCKMFNFVQNLHKKSCIRTNE